MIKKYTYTENRARIFLIAAPQTLTYMSFLLPHLHSGWAVDQAILAVRSWRSPNARKRE